MLEPRASAIPITHRSDVPTEIWFGGANSIVGEALAPEDLRGAWLVDCAGELPGDFAGAAALTVSRVFADIESVPSSFDAILGLARDLAGKLSGSEPPTDGAPPRVYVMCSQGFNRSALVAGLILREMGAEPADVLRDLRRSRPGSLSNETFVRLLLGG